MYSALSTCDPGDIMESIQRCKKSKIRCSVIGLSAELFICKHICQETGGSYSVALDEVSSANLTSTAGQAVIVDHFLNFKLVGRMLFHLNGFFSPKYV